MAFLCQFLGNKNFIMKNLCLILEKALDVTRYELWKASAEVRNLSINMVSSKNFDFSTEVKLTNEDGLYRVGRGKNARLIEKVLINDNVNSFYLSAKDCIRRMDHDLTHKKNNLPIIPTIFSITNDKLLLKKYIEQLGGFPVIIKATGGSLGIGVMKIDSLESLYSITDFLCNSIGSASFVLRKFIDYKEHARLIVLGDRVLSSIEYKRVQNDFRSNSGSDLKICYKKFDKKVEDLAIKAVFVLGYEFGGVDILIDQQENSFLAEANFPCDFSDVQKYANIDISGMMIDFLIEKSKKKIDEK